jgi:hypothetical protein
VEIKKIERNAAKFTSAEQEAELRKLELNCLKTKKVFLFFVCVVEVIYYLQIIINIIIYLKYLLIFFLLNIIIIIFKILKYILKRKK